MIVEIDFCVFLLHRFLLVYSAVDVSLFHFALQLVSSESMNNE